MTTICWEKCNVEQDYFSQPCVKRKVHIKGHTKPYVRGLNTQAPRPSISILPPPLADDEVLEVCEAIVVLPRGELRVDEGVAAAHPAARRHGSRERRRQRTRLLRRRRGTLGATRRRGTLGATRRARTQLQQQRQAGRLGRGSGGGPWRRLQQRHESQLQSLARVECRGDAAAAPVSNRCPRWPARINPAVRPRLASGQPGARSGA